MHIKENIKSSIDEIKILEQLKSSEAEDEIKLMITNIKVIMRASDILKFKKHTLPINMNIILKTEKAKVCSLSTKLTEKVVMKRIVLSVIKRFVVKLIDNPIIINKILKSTEGFISNFKSFINF